MFKSQPENRPDRPKNEVSIVGSSVMEGIANPAIENGLGASANAVFVDGPRYEPATFFNWRGNKPLVPFPLREFRFGGVES